METITFEFAPWEKELVYDNHGCPHCTEYKTKFTADSVQFQAVFNDVSRYIMVYPCWWEINERLTSTNTAQAEQIIKREFEQNDEIKNFIKQRLDEQMKAVAEKMKAVAEKMKPFELGYDWS